MLASLLPSLTFLIGLGGLTVGIYSFLDPVATPRIYGFPVASSSLTLTCVLQPAACSNPTNSRSPQTGFSRPYIHALGVRNLTTGLGIISLTWYWQLALIDTSPDTKLVAQRMVGIAILAGSLVPIVDAWVCWNASREAALAATNEKSVSNEGVEVGRRAGNLHAMRATVWLVGALWCLLG